MPEWWTYRLSDFLMFSRDTYYGLFTRYNQDLWPGQLAALALGVALLALVRPVGKWRDRFAGLILSAGWLVVGYAFHWQRFREINLAASWFAVACWIQAVLLVGSGVPGRRGPAPIGPTRSDSVGVGLLVLGVVIQPLIGPLLGRPWDAMEVFGMAPDPTATATMGLLLVRRSSRVLLVIPLLWCIVSGATLWTMEAPDAWVPIGVALSVGFRMIRRR